MGEPGEAHELSAMPNRVPGVVRALQIDNNTFGDVEDFGKFKIQFILQRG